jgi:hypothetical protein
MAVQAADEARRHHPDNLPHQIGYVLDRLPSGDAGRDALVDVALGFAPETVSVELVFVAQQWRGEATRRVHSQLLRHRLMYNALTRGMGLVGQPREIVKWCSGTDWDAHGKRHDTEVAEDAPDARLAVVRLEAPARVLLDSPV